MEGNAPIYRIPDSSLKHILTIEVGNLITYPEKIFYQINNHPQAICMGPLGVKVTPFFKYSWDESWLKGNRSCHTSDQSYVQQLSFNK